MTRDTNRRKKSTRSRSPWIAPLSLVAILGIVVTLLVIGARRRANPTTATPFAPSTIQPVPDTSGGAGALSTLEALQAVMVTVELDYGTNRPTIAEALQDIERRYKPNDGVGRTFSIIDAYGEETPSGKLHLSMHVSAEKPGLASLVFRRTGETLWRGRILPASKRSVFTGTDLAIRIDDGRGRLLTVDGSTNSALVLDAPIKELGVPTRQIWPEAAVREVTFLYSACGCPVKIEARRVGDRTLRTSEQPVIFPDDPAVVELISRLMGW